MLILTENLLFVKILLQSTRGPEHKIIPKPSGMLNIVTTVGIISNEIFKDRSTIRSCQSNGNRIPQFITKHQRNRISLAAVLKTPHHGEKITTTINQKVHTYTRVRGAPERYHGKDLSSILSRRKSPIIATTTFSLPLDCSKVCQK